MDTPDSILMMQFKNSKMMFKRYSEKQQQLDDIRFKTLQIQLELISTQQGTLRELLNSLILTSPTIPDKHKIILTSTGGHEMPSISPPCPQAPRLDPISPTPCRLTPSTVEQLKKLCRKCKS